MTPQDLEIKNIALDGGPHYNLVVWHGGQREVLGQLAPGMSQVVSLVEAQTLQVEVVRAPALAKPDAKQRVQPAPKVQPFPPATGKADVPVGTPVPPAAPAPGAPVTLAGNSNEVAGGNQ